MSGDAPRPRRPFAVHARLLRYLGPHSARFGAILLQLAVVSVLGLARPWPLKLAVDHVFGAMGGLPAWLPAERSTLFAVLIGASLLIETIPAWWGVWLNWQTIGLGQRLVNDFRADTVQHLHRLSLLFFTRHPPDDLVYRLTANTFSVQSITMGGLYPLGSALLTLGGMLAIMLRLDWRLTLVSIAVLPFFAVIIRSMSVVVGPRATRLAESESQLLSEAQRGVRAVHLVQAFTAEDDEVRRFMAQSERTLEQALKLYTLQTLYSSATTTVAAVGTVAVLYVGGGAVMAGRLTVGDLLVFLSYLASLYGPINSIVQTFSTIQAAAAQAQRVFEVLDSEPEVGSRPGAKVVSAPRGAVQFENVRFRYPAASELALVDVSFEVPDGTSVALVGPTGAGKTTLCSMIVRFFDPVEGTVRFDGVDLRDLDLKSYRRRLAVVPQSPLLFHATVNQNLLYGRPDASREQVLRAAHAAEAAGFIEKLPHGYDTVIGPDGVQLSLGQQQRLTIARALLRDPTVLILDEPTASLDAETERSVIHGIETLMKGRTTFVIAHRLSTVRRADLILVLENGRIVQRGTFDELRAVPGLFQRLVEAQFEEDTAPR